MPAPQTATLSPFVGTLTAQVAASAAALLGEDVVTDSVERLEAHDVRLRLKVGGGIVLADAAPQQRRNGGVLRLLLKDTPRPVRARIREALRSPKRRARMTTLAEALEAWWPLSRLDDERFRQIGSSPMGDFGLLRLGYRCNQDCWFCWQGRDWPAPPMSQYRRWLDELAAAGITALQLTGGEATTYTALPELITQAAGHGMKVSLQTNAIRLRRQRYTQALIAAGLTGVQVSLHSADAATSDAMTRAPGTHRLTVGGILQALQLGLPVSLTCVVESANIDGLPDHARLILDRFVIPTLPGSIIRVTYAHPTAYFEPERWSDQQVPLDRLRSPLSEAVALLRSAGVPVQLGGACGFAACAVDPEHVRPAYQVLHPADYTPQELTHRRYAAVCSGCRLKTSCFGLRQEYLDTFGSRGLVPT
ncbi:MAG: radical SAM protein [Myxococcota bacterium]|nr:radical SAM protein [Myxococcota bacterium]